MKREILFRGLREDGLGWVEGDLMQNYIHHEGYLTIVQGGCIYYKVLPESVGQFVGLKGYIGNYETRHDNEVKLFEGDIMEAMSQGSKGTFVIKMRTEAQPTFMLYPAWQEGKMWNIAASDLGREKGDYYDDLKRIGNIHENPELLKHQ